MSVNNSVPVPKEPVAWRLSDAATRALQIGLALTAVKDLVQAPLSTGPIGLFALLLDVALFFLVRRHYARAPRLVLLRALTLTVLLFLLAFFSVDPLPQLVTGALEGWFGLALILLSAGQPAKARSIAGLAVAGTGLCVYVGTLLLVILLKIV